MDIISELDDFGDKVDVVEAIQGAGRHEVKEEYGIDMADNLSSKYDAVNWPSATKSM